MEITMQMRYPAGIGICWMMAECNAIYARVTANSMKGSGGFALCAPANITELFLQPMVARLASASILLKRNRSITSYLEHRSFLLALQVATLRANFAKIGTFPNRVNLTDFRK